MEAEELFFRDVNLGHLQFEGMSVPGSDNRWQLNFNLELNYLPQENLCKIPGLCNQLLDRKSCVFWNAAATTSERQRTRLCFLPSNGS